MSLNVYYILVKSRVVYYLDWSHWEVSDVNFLLKFVSLWFLKLDQRSLSLPRYSSKLSWKCGQIFMIQDWFFCSASWVLWAFSRCSSFLFMSGTLMLIMSSGTRNAQLTTSGRRWTSWSETGNQEAAFHAQNAKPTAANVRNKEMKKKLYYEVNPNFQFVVLSVGGQR